MRSTRAVLLVATVAVATLVPGYSATGDTDTSGDAASSSRPIKVGMIAPIGPPDSDLPEMPAALSAGIEALNARGGLNGRRVKLVYCNDREIPERAAKCARRLVDQGVVAVLGNTGGALTESRAQPVLEEAGIPIIGSGTSNPLIWNGRNSYMISQPSLLSYESLIGYAVHKDLLPIAVTAADNPLGLQFAAFLEEKLKELTGGQGFAKMVPVSATTTDYAPIAKAITDVGAKSVLNVVAAPHVLGVARELHSAGSKAAMMSVAPLSVDELTNSGPSAGLMVSGFSYPPFGDPTMKRFRDEMAAAEAAGDEHASLRTASPYAAYGWVALQALERVTEDLDVITAKSVSTALDEAKDIDLGGIVPPWTPSKPGPAGMTRVSNASSWFAAFENGATVALADSAIHHDDIMAGNFEAQLPPGAR